jgi:DNA-binding transcriptional LysR family regulator
LLDNRIFTFLDLCKTRSFTQTAANLHMTQPAVSQHIKHLEEIYGAKLVYYKDRTVSITKQGKLLEKFARSMYINDKKFKKIMKSSVDSPKELSFASTRIISEFILPEVLPRYLEKYNYEKINMVVTESKEALNKLYLGEVDFVITDGSFRANDYKCAHLFREETIAVCSPFHPFAKYPVDFSELISERLIYRSQTSEAYNNLEMILSEKGYSIGDFKKTMAIGSTTSIKELVKHNVGITFLYRFAVQKELQGKSLAKINIRNFSIYRDIYFVWLKDSFFENDAFILFEYCRQFFSDYLDFSQPGHK